MSVPLPMTKLAGWLTIQPYFVGRPCRITGLHHWCSFFPGEELTTRLYLYQNHLPIKLQERSSDFLLRKFFPCSVAGEPPHA